MYSPQAVFLAALRKVLKPLVRLCLRHGVTYPMLLEELKRVFVSVADLEFPLEKKPQTDSRITLLTGVHRKDVHRLRSEGAQDVTVKPSLSSQVISLWLSHQSYVDEDGKPVKIRKSIAEGGGLSFESLVAKVSKDIRSKPLLDEWLRLGAVHVDEDGWLSLVSEAFVPSGDFEQLLTFFSDNIHDHMAAAVHNLSGGDPPYFERSAFSDALTHEQVLALHAFVQKEGMAFLRKVNHENILNSVNPSVEVGYRVNAGVYFFAEPQGIADDK